MDIRPAPPARPGRAQAGPRSLSAADALPACANSAADDAADRQEDRTSPCVLSEEIPQRLRSSAFLSASHAARCVACHGVRSHPVPVALVGECSIPSCRTSRASRARRTA